jgi:glycosyltransferase involved in cell wall biosynthesis
MRRDLRIGFVSAGDATDLHFWSGIPAQVVQNLRRLGVHVELYSPLEHKKGHLLVPFKLLARIRKSNIPLDRFPFILKSYASQISQAIQERPVDVIVSTSSIPITLLECTQPIIFWTDAVFHAMYDYYYNEFAGMPLSAVRRGKRQEEAALNNCAFAAYSSEWAARSARQLTDPQKIQVLPFGASFEIHHTRTDVEQWARQRRQERSGRCELLFIGVDWSRKGGAIAVEAAKILNEVGISTTLTVVGCQPPGNLPDYVRVLGFISKKTPEGRDQMQSLLRNSDFFILPTLAEAAGIVFCEASAFGLPSLSYATGGVPDYVRNGVNGACLPVGTPAAGFAQAIQSNLQDADRYEALCLGAFREYETRLNWDSSVRALIDLCHRALEPAVRV